MDKGDSSSVTCPGDQEREVRVQRETELKGFVLKAFFRMGHEPVSSQPKTEAGRKKLETRRWRRTWTSGGGNVTDHKGRTEAGEADTKGFQNIQRPRKTSYRSLGIAKWFREEGTLSPREELQLLDLINIIRKSPKPDSAATCLGVSLHPPRRESPACKCSFTFICPWDSGSGAGLHAMVLHMIRGRKEFILLLPWTSVLVLATNPYSLPAGFPFPTLCSIPTLLPNGVHTVGMWDKNEGDKAPCSPDPYGGINVDRQANRQFQRNALNAMIAAWLRGAT